MLRQPYILIILLACLGINACVETYMPDVDEANTSLLVVEGRLDNGISQVKLSRSSLLAGSAVLGEAGARVWVESESGDYQSELFLYLNQGSYEQELELSTKQRYRLMIETSDGKNYQSDYIPFKETPPIGDIEFEIQAGKVNYKVSTGDADGDTRYYRWEYDETWQYFAAFESYWRYRNGQMYFLPIAQQTFRCWQTESHTNIILANTSHLTDDVVSKQQLLTINPRRSNKLNVRYSLLVRQYALTAEGFEFWQRLKENTENLGTLFDPQPSQVPGNLQCISHPGETVIGFVSASSVSSKRIFNTRNDFDVPYMYDPMKDCVQYIQPDPIGFYDLDFAFADTTTFLPIDTVPGASRYWYASSPYCIDCRQQGGTTLRPDFW